MPYGQTILIHFIIRASLKCQLLALSPRFLIATRWLPFQNRAPVNSKVLLWSHQTRGGRILWEESICQKDEKGSSSLNENVHPQAAASHFGSENFVCFSIKLCSSCCLLCLDLRKAGAKNYISLWRGYGKEWLFHVVNPQQCHNYEYQQSNINAVNIRTAIIVLQLHIKSFYPVLSSTDGMWQSLILLSSWV